MTRVGRYVQFRARAGQRDALASKLLEVARSLAGTAGCELYVINAAADDADSLWVTEIWRSQADLDASLDLDDPATKASIGEVMALLAAPPERIDLLPLGGVGLEDE
jgi:quinol monooxygenase YgiN